MSETSKEYTPPKFERENYYEVLGVSRSASPKEIVNAYRQEAARANPYFNQVGMPEAEKQFKSALLGVLNRARETLTDPNRRLMYDVRIDAEARQFRPQKPSVKPSTTHAAEQARPVEVKDWKKQQEEVMTQLGIRAGIMLSAWVNSSGGLRKTETDMELLTWAVRKSYGLLGLFRDKKFFRVRAEFLRDAIQYQTALHDCDCFLDSHVSGEKVSDLLVAKWRRETSDRSEAEIKLFSFQRDLREQIMAEKYRDYPPTEKTKLMSGIYKLVIPGTELKPDEYLLFEQGFQRGWQEIEKRYRQGS